MPRDQLLSDVRAGRARPDPRGPRPARSAPRRARCALGGKRSAAGVAPTLRRSALCGSLEYAGASATEVPPAWLQTPGWSTSARFGTRPEFPREVSLGALGIQGRPPAIHAG